MNWRIRRFKKQENTITHYECLDCGDILADEFEIDCACGGEYFPVTRYEGVCELCGGDIDDLVRHVYVKGKHKICPDCYAKFS